MLINYTFSNFRSFKDKISLSMKAGTQRTLNENLIREDGIRVIPSTVVYGANASGKSNIIMSLAVMEKIILSGSLEFNVPELNNLELYPFAHNGDAKPMLFEIEFTNKGYHLIYGFEVLCTLFKKGSRRIVSENLSVVIGVSEKVKLFERDKDKVSIMKDKKALEVIQFNENLLGEFEKKINTNLDDAELFLSRAFKSTISNELAEAVLDFFKNKLIVVSDFTLKKTNLTFSLEDKPKKDFLMWNKILDGFVKNADFGPQSIAFKSTKTEDKDSADMELVSIYKNKNQSAMIPAELMESRGTLKLLDFAIPFETIFASGGVFVLDEFDAAIHPELIKGILALFNDQTVNTNGAQLIFTTHNPIYLNNKIFRRDQIRFVEKDKDTFVSAIYSLADFGSVDVRNDHNYLINYFKGKYGALPFIDFTKLLITDNSKEEE
ncbi:MAG: abortive infection protein [Peptococcaceae bacterium BICA1-8]|nr:MAG: abortive infection protein [Peptococcaceae bacterium BICA1-8]